MVSLAESTTTSTTAAAQTISDFLEGLRSSSIVSEGELAKVKARITDGDYPSDPAEVAARLIKDGVLTEYQARQIVKGRGSTLGFGSYMILEFLGKGTMGKVYKARHRMMGRSVALKILDSRYVARSDRSLARFQREMQLVGRLDHPNVVRAFDADRVSDCYFIAMEYASGYTLEDLLKAKGALPPADVVFYIAQAADGLAHAHARGVLHRDIKPANLMLTEGKKLKILDFGLGTLLEQDEQSSALTTVGTTVGTPDYISPEQARMVKLDGRSDLYSLGCTMYHLLCGQLPFKGESSMDCIVGRLTGKPIPINEVKPGLPPRLVQILEKMMASNPDDRFQSAEEVANLLKGLLRPKGTAAAAAMATATTPPPAPAVIPAAASPSAATPTPSDPVSAPAANGTPVESKPDANSNLSSKGDDVAALLALSRPAPADSPSPNLKRGSYRSTSSSDANKITKRRVVIATAAGAAVLLLGAALMIFNSSPTESTASNQEAAPANGGPAVPPAASDAPPPTSVAQNQNSAPAAVANARPAASQVETAKGAMVEKPKPAPAPANGANGSQPSASPSLVIEYPKQEATVDTKEDLAGQIGTSGGWPVIFVQAGLPGQPWWCQAAVTQVEGGRFTAKVVFGDESTTRGMKFRVAGIVVRTREEALKFLVGAKHYELPEGFPKSVEVVVTHR
jgi:eukaryotic-like serine/threonine-protein kinase